MRRTLPSTPLGSRAEISRVLRHVRQDISTEAKLFGKGIADSESSTDVPAVISLKDYTIAVPIAGQGQVS